MKTKNENKKGTGKIVFRMVALTIIVVVLVLLFGPSPENFINSQ